MMSVEDFFALFLDELRQHQTLQIYYKFLKGERSFLFRKNYFLRRLEFVQAHAGDKGNLIWDVGCGYGTTAIFLALNGYKVRGLTLEFYHDQIAERIHFWSQYGEVSNFTYAYEDFFGLSISPSQYDRIILQDTLHHLEPIDVALKLLSLALKPGCQIIAVEENGNNIIIRTQLFLQRGNKRIIEIFDKRLGKPILIGNENVRSLKKWHKIFEGQNFRIEKYEYIRLYMPFQWTKRNYGVLQAKEKARWKRNSLLREFAFFGLNFIATKV